MAYHRLIYSFYFSLLAASSSIVPSAAFADDPMEVGEVVAKILQGGYPGSMFVSWRFMADQESPIEWSEYRLGERNGKVMLAVDGVVPDELRESILPSPWSISMTGPNSGPTKINLTSHGCYDFDTDGICDSAQEKIIKSLEETVFDIEEVCRFGPGSVSSRVFHLEGDNNVYAGIVQHAGSSGYSYELTLIPSIAELNDLHPLEERTSICAAFFNHQYGSSGSRYIEYRDLLD